MVIEKLDVLINSMCSIDIKIFIAGGTICLCVGIIIGIIIGLNDRSYYIKGG